MLDISSYGGDTGESGKKYILSVAKPTGYNKIKKTKRQEAMEQKEDRQKAVNSANSGRPKRRGSHVPWRSRREAGAFLVTLQDARRAFDRRPCSLLGSCGQGLGTFKCSALYINSCHFCSGQCYCLIFCSLLRRRRTFSTRVMRIIVS